MCFRAIPIRVAGPLSLLDLLTVCEDAVTNWPAAAAPTASAASAAGAAADRASPAPASSAAAVAAPLASSSTDRPFSPLLFLGGGSSGGPEAGAAEQQHTASRPRPRGQQLQQSSPGSSTSLLELTQLVVTVCSELCNLDVIRASASAGAAVADHHGGGSGNGSASGAESDQPVDWRRIAAQAERIHDHHQHGDRLHGRGIGNHAMTGFDALGSKYIGGDPADGSSVTSARTDWSRIRVSLEPATAHRLSATIAHSLAVEPQRFQRLHELHLQHLASQRAAAQRSPYEKHSKKRHSNGSAIVAPLLATGTLASAVASSSPATAAAGGAGVGFGFSSGSSSSPPHLHQTLPGQLPSVPAAAAVGSAADASRDAAAQHAALQSTAAAAGIDHSLFDQAFLPSALTMPAPPFPSLEALTSKQGLQVNGVNASSKAGKASRAGGAAGSGGGSTPLSTREPEQASAYGIATSDSILSVLPTSIRTASYAVSVTDGGSLLTPSMAAMVPVPHHVRDPAAALQQHQQQPSQIYPRDPDRNAVASLLPAATAIRSAVASQPLLQAARTMSLLESVAGKKVKPYFSKTEKAAATGASAAGSAGLAASAVAPSAAAESALASPLIGDVAVPDVPPPSSSISAAVVASGIDELMRVGLDVPGSSSGAAAGPIAATPAVASATYNDAKPSKRGRGDADTEAEGAFPSSAAPIDAGGRAGAPVSDAGDTPSGAAGAAAAAPLAGTRGKKKQKRDASAGAAAGSGKAKAADGASGENDDSVSPTDAPISQQQTAQPQPQPSHSQRLAEVKVTSEPVPVPAPAPPRYLKLRNAAGAALMLQLLPPPSLPLVPTAAPTSTAVAVPIAAAPASDENVVIKVDVAPSDSGSSTASAVPAVATAVPLAEQPKQLQQAVPPLPVLAPPAVGFPSFGIFHGGSDHPAWKLGLFNDNAGSAVATLGVRRGGDAGPYDDVSLRYAYPSQSPIGSGTIFIPAYLLRESMYTHPSCALDGLPHQTSVTLNWWTHIAPLFVPLSMLPTKLIDDDGELLIRAPDDTKDGNGNSTSRQKGVSSSSSSPRGAQPPSTSADQFEWGYGFKRARRGSPAPVAATPALTADGGVGDGSASSSASPSPAMTAATDNGNSAASSPEAAIGMSIDGEGLDERSNTCNIDDDNLRMRARTMSNMDLGPNAANAGGIGAVPSSSTLDEYTNLPAAASTRAAGGSASFPVPSLESSSTAAGAAAGGAGGGGIVGARSFISLQPYREGQPQIHSVESSAALASSTADAVADSDQAMAGQPASLPNSSSRLGLDSMDVDGGDASRASSRAAAAAPEASDDGGDRAASASFLHISAPSSAAAASQITSNHYGILPAFSPSVASPAPPHFGARFGHHASQALAQAVAPVAGAGGGASAGSARLRTMAAPSFTGPGAGMAANAAYSAAIAAGRTPGEAMIAAQAARASHAASAQAMAVWTPEFADLGDAMIEGRHESRADIVAKLQLGPVPPFMTRDASTGQLIRPESQWDLWDQIVDQKRAMYERDRIEQEERRKAERAAEKAEKERNAAANFGLASSPKSAAMPGAGNSLAPRASSSSLEFAVPTSTSPSPTASAGAAAGAAAVGDLDVDVGGSTPAFNLASAARAGPGEQGRADNHSGAVGGGDGASEDEEELDDAAYLRLHGKANTVLKKRMNDVVKAAEREHQIRKQKEAELALLHRPPPKARAPLPKHLQAKGASSKAVLAGAASPLATAMSPSAASAFGAATPGFPISLQRELSTASSYGGPDASPLLLGASGTGEPVEAAGVGAAAGASASSSTTSSPGLHAIGGATPSASPVVAGAGSSRGGRGGRGGSAGGGAPGGTGARRGRPPAAASAAPAVAAAAAPDASQAIAGADTASQAPHAGADHQVAAAPADPHSTSTTPCPNEAASRSTSAGSGADGGVQPSPPPAAAEPGSSLTGVTVSYTSSGHRRAPPARHE